MNKRKIVMNTFIILTIIISLLTAIIPNYCYAKDSLGLGDLNEYEGTNSGSTRLVDKAKIILASIRNMGIVLSVVMLIIIGIKYMLGSIEEKATYKKTLLPYLIGAVLLFTGSLIPEIIYQVTQNF